MKNDLFQFPFRSEVWGTAADWTMVVVTAVTLWYLVKTLRSQLQVQKLQQKSTAIQNSIYLKDFRPSLKLLSCRIEPAGALDGVKYQQIVILLEVVNNNCIHLDYKFDDIRSKEPFNPVGDKLWISYNKEFLIGKPVIVAITNDPIENMLPLEFWCFIEISFEDHSNNRYRQSISLRKTQDFEVEASIHEATII